MGSGSERLVYALKRRTPSRRGLVNALKRCHERAMSTATATAIRVKVRKPSPKCDERLVELVDFVERERGLDFKHPVPIRFLTERQFKRAVARGQGELSPQDRAGLERSAGLLRALGLIEDGSVLLEGTRAVQGAELAAFYDWDLEELVIRGRRLDTLAEATVVHELTHTLQDGYFDLSELVDTASSRAVLSRLLKMPIGIATRPSDAPRDPTPPNGPIGPIQARMRPNSRRTDSDARRGGMRDFLAWGASRRRPRPAATGGGRAPLWRATT